MTPSTRIKFLLVLTFLLLDAGKLLIGPSVDAQEDAKKQA